MRNQTKLISRAWKMLEPFHKWFYMNLGLAFALSGISVGLTSLSSYILNLVTLHNTKLLLISFALMFFLEIFWNIINYIKSNNEQTKLGQDISQHLQEYSLKKILSLTPEQHIERHSAITQQIIVRGESAVGNIVSSITADILPNLSYLIIAVGTLTWYYPPIGLSTILICIILMIWVFSFTNFYRPLIKQNRDNWIEQSKFRTEAFVHLSLVKNLARESYFIKKYILDRKSAADYDVKIGLINLKHKTKRSIFISSSDNLIFLFAIFLTLQGNITVGGIFLVWTLVSRVFWSIAGLSNSLRDLPLRALESEKYFDAIDLEPNFKENGVQGVDLRKDIIVTNLSFHYPKSDALLFEDISFTIPKEKITAFVGPSGSGKSTVTKLLLRSYNYSTGTITIGNHELRDIDAHFLREHIGHVEQHVDLLDDTIRENILISARPEKRNEAEVKLEEVAKLARIDQFYHRLGEKKFDTVVGERGIKLSGGERQRIGIARAIIKNPEILIFDEATSSLDTENEKYVMDAIKDVSQGKTTIIIAHRLSTIKDADKIIVMDKGKVVGEGTHDQLLLSCKEYQILVQHQVSE